MMCEFDETWMVRINNKALQELETFGLYDNANLLSTYGCERWGPNDPTVRVQNVPIQLGRRQQFKPDCLIESTSRLDFESWKAFAVVKSRCFSLSIQVSSGCGFRWGRFRNSLSSFVSSMEVVWCIFSARSITTFTSRGLHLKIRSNLQHIRIIRL